MGNLRRVELEGREKKEPEGQGKRGALIILLWFLLEYLAVAVIFAVVPNQITMCNIGVQAVQHTQHCGRGIGQRGKSRRSRKRRRRRKRRALLSFLLRSWSLRRPLLPLLPLMRLSIVLCSSLACTYTSAVECQRRCTFILGRHGADGHSVVRIHVGRCQRFEDFFLLSYSDYFSSVLYLAYNS